MSWWKNDYWYVVGAVALAAFIFWEVLFNG